MYVIIWQFVVKPGAESDFERAYGPDGIWSQFFRRGPGYLGTELLRDLEAVQRYLTIDRWSSRAAFESFQARFAGGYAAIDRQCEALTESETRMGSFESAGGQEPTRESDSHDEP
jgi:quinol monooxygenase YgiN